MGKKLTVYMIDGTEYGPRIVEIGNWVGKALYSPRVFLNKVLKRSDGDNPGIYCLKSISKDATFSERVYIGEAENINERLKQHLANTKKDFDELIFFISKDDLLTKTQIKYLETRIIELAIEAKSAEIENGKVPNRPKLTEADISDMEYFLEQIKLILPLMGFRFLISKVAVKMPERETGSRFSGEIYKIKSSTYKAEMFENEQGYIVVKGSQANKNLSPSITSTYINLRQKLIDSKILKESTDYYEFTEDTVFNSPSAASNIILGRQSAGPIEWINSENKTYKEVTESQ